MIERVSLRSQAENEIRDRILGGELAPGERLREVHLASLLGVSRTPLREALRGLEREGLVESAVGKGFSVCPLTRHEAEELYPLRALLEPHALSQAGVPDSEVIDELTRRNEELADSAPNSGWIDRDVAWHELLLRHCRNDHLLRIIDQLRHHTRRYELAFLKASGTVDVSVEQHERILTSLKAQDLETACALLRENMLVGLEPILEWLEGSGSVSSRASQ